MADDFPQEPKSGGVTHHDPNPNTPKSEDELFNTSGNEPVRDRKADPKKGFPVTRWFTKDGTPVEPGSIPVTKFDEEPDLEARPDVVAVVEYTNAEGDTITHDMLKKQHEDEARKKDQEKDHENDK